MSCVFLVWKHLSIACAEKITLKMIQCTDDTWFEDIIFFAIYSYACLNNVYFVMYILSYMMCCVLVSLDEMLWNPIDMSQHIYTLCWIKFTGFTLKNGNQTDNGAPEMSCDIHWMCCFSNNPQPHYQNHHFNYSWAYEYFCYFIYFCADF